MITSEKGEKSQFFTNLFFYKSHEIYSKQDILRYLFYLLFCFESIYVVFTNINNNRAIWTF